MSDGVSASMFKKLKDFLIGRKAGDITPAEAHKIQKASYALAHTEVKKTLFSELRKHGVRFGQRRKADI